MTRHRAIDAARFAVLACALASLPAASIPTPAYADMAAGNRSRGIKLFKQCQGCHSVRAGQHNSFGPNLYRVIGRKAGSLGSYPYSDALRNAGFEWTPERLDAYVADPQGYLPGVRMKLAPIADAQARADIIAYIIAASERQ